MPENDDLKRKVERLETQVFFLGAVAGIMLSLVKQLGWPNVTDAIYRGLADAAASVPPQCEADWDDFMALLRKHGEAVKVQRVATRVEQQTPADRSRP